KENYNIGGPRYAVKVARTVRIGGKVGDNLKDLPIDNLEDGYIYEDGKFYRIIDTHRGNNQAAEGCDLGWC
ncbi:hypothetical protein SIL03_11145, partial [Bacillus cereus group sp. BfR-BA-00415]|nr:hypothetical protein [Bacillus cereus group sp. BfR-BA-00415]